jgi:hypothetical protein
VAAALDLTALAEDPAQPGIVRATALWLLETEGEASTADRLAPLLGDDDPLVRAAAIGLQRNADPQDRVLRLIDLLSDPSRSVRMAAAQGLVNAPVARLPGTTQAAFDTAMAEWQSSMSSRLDFPETHLQLGGWALTMRNLPAATQAFRNVVSLDPQRADAWAMLVRIAAATEGRARARSVLGEAIEAVPSDPGLQALARELEPR